MEFKGKCEKISHKPVNTKNGSKISSGLLVNSSWYNCFGEIDEDVTGHEVSAPYTINGNFNNFDRKKLLVDGTAYNPDVKEVKQTITEDQQTITYTEETVRPATKKTIEQHEASFELFVQQAGIKELMEHFGISAELALLYKINERVASLLLK